MAFFFFFAFTATRNLFEEHVSQALLINQVDGLTRKRPGNDKSLRELGYSSVGLDDGWQLCGENGYHDETTGAPVVNTTRFPNMRTMTDYARLQNVSMGWYGNNCGCHGTADVDRYTQDAIATVKYGFTSTKIDSCGPETNISKWRAALDAASAAHGDGSRIGIENCRNYVFTKDLSSSTADCGFEMFRSTEDNSPDFLSIMANLVTNQFAPASKPNFPWGGLPVSHPGCWSYPDMLETIGSGKCHQDLKNGTCGFASASRREGGLTLNESQAHFSAWCVVSSPLILGHDLSDDAQYDAAWPVISNEDAIRVNQAWAGDPGRLIAQSDPTKDMQGLELYHGAGCECVWPGQSLPQWTVWAKRTTPLEGDTVEAGVLAINLSDKTLPAGTIAVPAALIFGTNSSIDMLQSTADAGGGGGGGRDGAVFSFTSERNIWTGVDRVYTHKATMGKGSGNSNNNGNSNSDGSGSGSGSGSGHAVTSGGKVDWEVPELGPHSSYFARLKH